LPQEARLVVTRRKLAILPKEKKRYLGRLGYVSFAAVVDWYRAASDRESRARTRQRGKKVGCDRVWDRILC